jgi:hypothetical protein
MEDQHEVDYEEYEESWTGRIAIAAVVALALIGGAFFAGRALAGSSGPATLAEAVTQAQAGDLPCGDTGAAAPAGTPAPQGTRPGGGAPGGAGFALRAICQPGTAQGQGQARGRFGGAGGLGQTGRVSAVSADSLTLTGPMGETTVKLDTKTTINKSSKGELTNIKTGDSVLVSGARPDTGSAATSITILPQTDGN